MCSRSDVFWITGNTFLRHLIKPYSWLSVTWTKAWSPVHNKKIELRLNICACPLAFLLEEFLELFFRGDWLSLKICRSHCVQSVAEVWMQTTWSYASAWHDNFSGGKICQSNLWPAQYLKWMFSWGWRHTWAEQQTKPRFQPSLCSDCIQVSVSQCMIWRMRWTSSLWGRSNWGVMQSMYLYCLGLCSFIWLLLFILIYIWLPSWKYCTWCQALWWFCNGIDEHVAVQLASTSHIWERNLFSEAELFAAALTHC